MGAGGDRGWIKEKEREGGGGELSRGQRLGEGRGWELEGTEIAKGEGKGREWERGW